ncbi:MAG TPA: anti-sigma factor [Candidatus Acidoferrales bacterium]|nr:anti-sigma factor [Candidatus Acidoferrales bacterium]
MVCDDNARFLQGYLDGELDLVRSLEIEEHLKTCPDCAQELWNQQTLRKAFRSSSLYERAPARLADRIRASVAREATAGASTNAAANAAPTAENAPAKKAMIVSMTPAPISSKRAAWNWLAVAAAVLLMLTVTWRIVPGLSWRGNSDLLTEEIVSSHIRSLQPDHLFDVKSTDQHTVKPWFNGKLDFSPPVRDLAEDGYPLVGGRLDYVDHRAVAALVYQRRQHLINVFIWPEGKESGQPARMKSVHGYNMVAWEANGMYHCAVSDLNRGELEQFAELLRK